MAKFFQIINEKIVPKSLIKFKHSPNLAGQQIEPVFKDTKKPKLNVKNNKLLIYIPLKSISEDGVKNICYTICPPDIKCRKNYISFPVKGFLSKKWIDYKSIKDYIRSFKNDLELEQYRIIVDMPIIEEPPKKSDKNTNE